jgi:hypothetical protein
MFTVTGSYVTPFMICAGISVFAAAILLPVKPKYWLEMKAKIKGEAASTST